MNKFSIIVPKDIKYLSDWKEFSLSNYQSPIILNKVLTGCGFTEYCISCDLNIILCSPRKILLENKRDQHKGQVYYAENTAEDLVNFEKDLNNLSPKKRANMTDEDEEGDNPESYEQQFITEDTKERLKEIKDKKVKAVIKLKEGVKEYWRDCSNHFTGRKRPCKILVTYDSFRHIKEALGDNIKFFHIVVDEMQAVMTDSKFKSNAELEFVSHLQGLDKVCYASATPMMEKYLDQIPEFKDLPYYQLDWTSEDPWRVVKPKLNINYCGKRNIYHNLKEVINEYLEGKFAVYRYRDENGLLKEIHSKEAVIFLNSVKEISKVIKACGLKPSQCNVLVSKTDANEKTIREAFGKNKLGTKVSHIGKVPKQGEPHKMFTFCTRTVYLGADFYSPCARTFIFSNANIDSLSVDISLDLPQILGRQRLDENPWRNEADLYVTLRYEGKKSDQEFEKRLKEKDDMTKDLLEIYDDLNPDEKRKRESLALKYESDAANSSYKNDFVAVNRHDGKSMKVVLNNLVRLAEIRAFEIQTIDYSNRFSVLSAVRNSGTVEERRAVDDAILEFNSVSYFKDKMKVICDTEAKLTEHEFDVFLKLIPIRYSNYVFAIGTKKIKACKYVEKLCEEYYSSELSNQSQDSNLKETILKTFSVGSRYSNQDIKRILGTVYSDIGYKKTPKATDLWEWFNLKRVFFDGSNGFEIVSLK